MRQHDERRSVWPILAGLGLVLGGLAWWSWRSDAPAPTGAVEAVAGDVSAGSMAMAGERPVRGLAPRLADRAAIAGKVTDKAGQALAGAQVCAWGRSRLLDARDTRKPSCATSERDGHYRIEGLFPVRHRVLASAPGFIPGVYERGAGATRSETVELRPGMEARDIDIALAGGGVEIHGVVKDLSGGPVEGAQVAGEKGLALSGADGAFSMWVGPGDVWLTAQADGYASGHDSGAAPGHTFEIFLTPEAVLIGKVVRAGDGGPIAGARVTASSGFWNESAAITEADGSFRLDGLEPGAYKARAEADDAVGMAEEQAILGLGETSQPIVITAHPAFMVEGRVVVEGGASCEEGHVNLEDQPNARDSGAEVEADGVARLRGLLPGEYEVNVRCDGFVSAERYDRVVIADRSLSGVTWTVTRGQSIRGVVVDGAGKPVRDVSVSAQPRPDPSQPRAHKTNTWGGQTDDAGTFELAGLLPGVYDVDVNAWDPPRATPPKPIEVTLAKGKDVEGLRIELPATGEVRGAVRDEQGRPVAKAAVRMSDGVQWHSASAADDGSFAFPFVAPGDYRVTVSQGWFSSMRKPGTSDDDVQGEKVQVQAGKTATVKLVVESVAGGLTGVVRDAGGGPVADAFVEATRESDSAAKAAGGAKRQGRWGSFWQKPHLTDQDGKFTLTDLPSGKYTVRAYRKGGGEGIREHVELGREVELTIAEAGRMSGTVVVRGGGAPDEFSVNIEDEATGYRRYDNFFRTGGAWSLAEVPAGNYKIRVGSGPGTAEVEAAMREGEDTTGIRVELAPKITVRGKVVDVEGAPVPGMTVHISGAGAWAGGDEQKLNVTDEQGRFEVAHAPTGQVTVSVWPPSWSNSEFHWTQMPARFADTAATVELAPIQVARRKVKDGEAGGDVGYTIKEAEPGADPLAARLIVAVVRPGGPAAAAGLQVGDEITSVDGHDVTGPRTYLHRGLISALPGATITLGLARGNSVQLVVGARP